MQTSASDSELPPSYRDLCSRALSDLTAPELLDNVTTPKRFCVSLSVCPIGDSRAAITSPSELKVASMTREYGRSLPSHQCIEAGRHPAEVLELLEAGEPRVGDVVIHLFAIACFREQEQQPDHGTVTRSFPTAWSS